MMQSIIVALEAICERIDAIEIEFMGPLKALKAKYEFNRCVSNGSIHGSKEWKSDCNSTRKSTQSSTPNLTIDNNSSTKPNTESITDTQVNVLVSHHKRHIQSRSKTSKAQLGPSNTFAKSIPPPHSYQMHIIVTGDVNALPEDSEK